MYLVYMCCACRAKGKGRMMSFLTSVLMFSDDTKAVERLNSVIKDEWGVFYLVGEWGGWVQIWCMTVNHLRIDDLVTLINTNAWHGTPQLFTMTEDEHKYTECAGLNPHLIRSHMVRNADDTRWAPGRYVERGEA